MTDGKIHMGRLSRGLSQLRGGQEGIFPLGARIVLAVAFLGVLGAIFLTARAGDGGMLTTILLRREPLVAASPRLTEADLVWLGKDLLVRLPTGATLGKVAWGERGQSMQPGLGPGHLVVIVPQSVIMVGDIISFDPFPDIPALSSSTLHRVVEIGQDDKGWYAITKGDNVFDRDPGRVRATQVKGVVIMELK